MILLNVGLVLFVAVCLLILASVGFGLVRMAAMLASQQEF